MKRIILLALIFFTGVTANQTFAQKNENKVVCFKSDMDCSQCESTIAEYLKFEKGVKKLEVDHASNTILIEYKEGKNSDEGFAAAIKKKGYKAEKITKEEYSDILEHVEEEGHAHGTEVHRVRK